MTDSLKEANYKYLIDNADSLDELQNIWQNISDYIDYEQPKDSVVLIEYFLKRTKTLGF